MTGLMSKMGLKLTASFYRMSPSWLHCHLRSWADRPPSTSVSCCVSWTFDLGWTVFWSIYLSWSGTIGHVAHGKSTVVKALTGVLTVRFKNEKERNITIKLGYANAKVSGQKLEWYTTHGNAWPALDLGLDFQMRLWPMSKTIMLPISW